MARTSLFAILAAEQLGHSPQMTLSTYAQVLRELKGLPPASVQAQIHAARESRRPLVDHGPMLAPEADPAIREKCLQIEAIAPGGFEPPTSPL
jgi:hypothetical protein